jgi:hypothetical protein
MSDHIWTQENIAAYVLGGLEPAERERLERHVTECTACAHAVEETRTLERKVLPWFASADPGPSLEDRILQALPASPPPRRRLPIGRPRLLLAAAASLLLAAVGFTASTLMEEDFLAFPEPNQPVVAANGPLAPHTWAESDFAGTDGTVTLTAKGKRGYVDGNAGGRSIVNGFPNDGEWRRAGEGKPAKADPAESAVKSAAKLADELQERTAAKLTRELDELKDQVKLGRGDQLGDHAFRAIQDLSGKALDLRAGAVVAEQKHAESEAARAKHEPAASMPAGDLNGRAGGLKGSPAGGGFGGGGFGKPSAAGGAGAPGQTDAKTLGFGLNTTYDARPLGEKDAKGQGQLLWHYTDNFAPPPLAQQYFKPGDDLARVPATVAKPVATPSAPELMPAAPAVTGLDTQLAQKASQAGKGDEGKKEAGTPPGVDAPPPAELAPQKIIIRSGEVEFEVDSFDNSVAVIQRLIGGTRGGFIATINSDKLANGKVRGSVVVRIPPEQLDKFVLDLRKELGKTSELKSQRIGSKDVTKEYTDLESRLRAARSMEERLLKIIKEGKGAIKDLLQAEKELGVWRTKIEEMEGEIRYLRNLVSLSTLTINLTEKEIRTAAIVNENERVQTGIEVEDVEKAHQEALKAITELKGRVTRSEVKQLAAGQFSALLHFEVSPENTGPMRDRLKQLGTMARLQIDRIQQTPSGAPAPKDGKIERGNTQFIVSLYNLANIAPRETVILRLAVADVPAVYQKLREAIAKAQGHLVNAQLNEQDRQNINAQLDFDIRRLVASDVQVALAGAGETLSRQVNRVPENDNVTDSKVLYRITLVDADAIPPRETVVMRIAAVNVPAAYQKLRDGLAKAKTRTLNAQLNEQDRRKVSAQLDFTYRRGDEGMVRAALAATGETLSRQVTRVPESANVTDAKVLVRLEILDADELPPRETVVSKIAAADVAEAYETLRTAILKAKGRIANAQLNEQDHRNVTANLVFDVPRSDEGNIRTLLGTAGETLTRQIARQQDTSNFTETRVGFQIELLPAAAILPRETTTLALEVADVNQTLSLFSGQVKEAQGRVVETQVGKQKNGQESARVVFDVPLRDAGGLVDKFKTAGQVRVHQVIRNPQAPEGKLALGRLEITLSNTMPAPPVPPRDTFTLELEVSDVPGTLAAFASQVKEVQGRTVDTQSSQDKTGRASARVVYDVPLAAAAGLAEKLKAASQHVQSYQVKPDPEAPEGKLAVGRLVVTLSNVPGLLPRDQGLWAQLRSGLAFSLRGLSISASWLIVGLLFVLPWVLVLYVIFLLARRMWRSAAIANGTAARNPPAP